MWLTYRGGDFAGRNVEVTGSSFVIGRDESCDLTLDDERASRQHARITVQADGTTTIEDLGSSNGTTVNGQRITAPTTLDGGETIQIGSTILATSDQEPSGAATTLGQVPGAAAAGGASPSVIQRIKDNTRRTKIAVGLGAAALGVVVLIAVLAIAGVFSGGGDDEPTTAEIVDDLRPSTALIFNVQNGDKTGIGTGWVLNADEGLIVTNAHVTNSGDSFTAAVNGEEQPAELVGMAQCEDLAVLRVSDTDGLKTLPLADNQDDLTEGDRVVAVGFPGSISRQPRLTATEGVVSVARINFDAPIANDVPNYVNLIQTDASINPGNSGGPLVNTNSELVGVNSAGRGDRDNQGFAIGVERVKEIIPGLSEGESIGWTGLGFLYVSQPQNVADNLRNAGFPVVPGIVVTGAFEGTPADGAGFNDTRAFIVAVNGTALDGSDGNVPGSLASFCNAIDQGESGDSVRLTVFTPGATEPQNINVDFE